MKKSLIAPRFIVLLLVSVSVAVLGIVAIAEDVPQQTYSVLEKGYYLSPEEGVWIRPGYKFKFLNVTMPADRKPVVTFNITDANGQPLDREGKVTPGVVSTSWVLAYIPQNSPQYVAYTTRVQTSPDNGKSERQASSDQGGTYTPMGNGTYQYRFGTALPENYDQAATHTIGMYGTRNLTEFGLSNYVANEFYDWVPNGSQVTKVRDVVGTAACNQCHDPLGLHGGSRQQVKLCVMCHTPQSVDPDTGNTVDMAVMTHKIHFGPNLPSVKAGKPYIIVGNRQSIHDYSHTTYPQDIRNCQTCHKDTTQVNEWLLNPTRAYCGESCHDNINWETGEGHAAGPQSSDNLCARCHYPEGEMELDAGIKTAHVPPYRSSQLPNPVLEVLSFTNTAPDQSPTVKFRLKDKNGNVIDPNTLPGNSRLQFSIAGPNTDYSWYVRESAIGKSTAEADGVYSYTFTAKVPSTAQGSYTLASEGRVATPGKYTNVSGTVLTTYNDPIPNVVKPFAVTGDTVTPRRSVVDMANCNKCHDKLMAHGNNRSHVDDCVVCHNPTLTQDGEPFSMQVMIHKIHTGEELNHEYLGFNEVLYPGDRRDCLQCHKAGTYTVPVPKGTIAVNDPSAFWTPMLPTSAACLGCHDSADAAAHAFVNTAISEKFSAEACSVCHKESADFAVSKVHAR